MLDHRAEDIKAESHEETPALPAEAPETLSVSPARLQRLSDILCDEISRGTMAGAVVMIGRRSRVAYLEAIGIQDVRSGAAMRLDSIFRIYSMSKPILAVAGMMLVEEGRLRIDERLSKYIPAFAEVQVAHFEGDHIQLRKPIREIMIHDLLRHAGGLSHEMMMSPLQSLYAQAQLARRDRSNEEHADAVAALPLLCHPGAEWHYSRSFEILGRVIEIVSQETLGDFLRERLFAPLRMQDTGFYVSEDRNSARLAEPFRRIPGLATRWRCSTCWRSLALKQGGVVSYRRQWIMGALLRC